MQVVLTNAGYELRGVIPLALIKPDQIWSGVSGSKVKVLEVWDGWVEYDLGGHTHTLGAYAFQQKYKLVLPIGEFPVEFSGYELDFERV